MVMSGRPPRTRTRTRTIQAAAIGVCAAPALWLAFAATRDQLGANPIEEITHVTGETTLRLLLLTLAVTPLRRLLHWAWLAPLRRTFGLFAFGYGTLHGLTYVALDQGFDWPLLVEDVVERRYITAGAFGLLCMVPLAATSTRGMMRRLGRHWVSLHRLAYVAAIAGVIHYLWLVKADLVPPLAHGAILAVLLGYRVYVARSRRTPAGA
jgi:sulfoxide reductase heme-binding subunit YedZ